MDNPRTWSELLMLRAILLLMLLSLGFDVRAGIDDVGARDVSIEIHWHADNLAELKLSVDSAVAVHDLRVPANLRLRLLDGQLHTLQSDALALNKTLKLQLRGRPLTIAKPSLQIRDANAFKFALVDEDGRIWLNFDHAHPQQRVAGKLAEWRHFDVRIGAALAEQIGNMQLVGSPLASASLRMTLSTAAKVVTGCATPNFPNTGNFVIDVALTEIDTADATCNGSCSGGGAANAIVKLTPSAKLQGVGTADAPWYEKFMTSPHNYPYVGNDQHPFLVWAAYRINALGQIEQIARSGAKHAFFSVNQFPNGTNGCGCGPANVLWSGCTDTYGWATNDSSAVLAPRNEIIPARGQWGRCGSLRDADCNGVDDAPFFSTFDHRALAPEAAITPARNPGARWYIEAWYVVRDDVNLSNSLGHQRIVPSWTPAPSSKWMLNFYEPGGTPFYPFVSGPAFDEWLAPGTTTAMSMSRDLTTADGHLRLSVKVVPIAGSKYRYDYALMNFDFMRAVTTGAEPNLAIVSNLGVGALSLPLASFSGVSTDMHLGSEFVVEQWNVEHSNGVLRFTAAQGTSQPWGALYRFSVTTNLPPETDVATITPAAAGAPASFSIDTLVPSTSTVVFASGFE